MKRTLRGLVTASIPITGRAYLCWGVGLFGCKYLLDLCLAHFGFGQSWFPTDYLLPRPGRFEPGGSSPVTWGLPMVGIALPFIWVGVNLTVRRLRTLAWPVWVVCFFFVPYLNVILFSALVLKRSNSARFVADEPKPSRPANSAVVVLALAAASVALIALATIVLRAYGWGLFIGIPFFTGFIPALKRPADEPKPFVSSLMVMLCVQSVIAVCLLVISLEGIICIMMAAPLSLLLGTIGAAIGCGVRKVPAFTSARPELGSATFLLLPILILSEARLKPEPTLFKVSSRIKINASPAQVWQSVVTFSELPPPTEMIFRAGLAYRIRAEIRGHGVGAIRHCVFSTGPFVEPITVWNEPNLLRFAVTSNPPPMRELSFREVDPPHLQGYLQSEQGQFELVVLPDGATDLVGTTWYRHGLWPENYWKLWSDHIIHTIHLRVLEHIKAEVEGSGQLSPVRLGK